MTSSIPPFDALLALHPRDRRWLLLRLTPTQRRALVSALDRHSATAPVEAPPSNTAMELPSGVRGVRSSHSRSPDEVYLLSAKAEEVQVVLDTLPKACSIAVLRHARWSWSAAIVASLSDDDKQKVSLNSGSGLQASATFIRWLLHSVAEGLREHKRSNVGELPPGKRFEALLE
jgi:hypothetical protein